MTQATRERLQFLIETVAKERRHLLLTTQRLFAEEINTVWVTSLEERPDVAERLDAFVARFGRLQDTLGDKLIPALLRHLLENPGLISTTSIGWKNSDFSPRSMTGSRPVTCTID